MDCIHPATLGQQKENSKPARAASAAVGVWYLLLWGLDYIAGTRCISNEPEESPGCVCFALLCLDHLSSLPSGCTLLV